jgi:hypothetical protein
VKLKIVEASRLAGQLMKDRAYEGICSIEWSRAKMRLRKGAGPVELLSVHCRCFEVARRVAAPPVPVCRLVASGAPLLLRPLD